MTEKKSSSSVWWPKRVFNWSNSSAEEKTSTNATANRKDSNSDSASFISLDSQDINTQNNKYINLLVKRIRKRLKMSGNDGSDRLTPWMSDSNAKQCYECGEKFTALRRRHHCRICGQIFCTKCCDEEIDAKVLGLNTRGSVRCCNYCHKIVNQYLNEKTYDSDSANRDSEFNQFREILFSKSLVENSTIDQNDSSLPNKSGEQISSSVLSTHSFHSFRRKGSIGFREEEYAKPKTTVLEIERETLNKSVPSPLHSFSSFGSYKTVVKGNDNSDDEVMPLRNEEMSREPLWVKEINDDSDSLSFDKIDTSSELFESNDSHASEPLMREKKPSPRRIAYSTSTYDIELDFEKDRVSVSKANKTDISEEKSTNETKGVNETKKLTNDGMSFDFGVTTTSLNWESLKEGTEEKLVYDLLNTSYNQLYNKLLTQLLEEEGLSLSWLNVIQRISGKVSSVVRPNSHNDFEEMDVRNYVKIKTIPNGVKNDCHIVNGVVISKNVVNRKMRQNLTHPRILLLSCPIVYQRYEKKLTLMDNVLLQENEYIKNLVAKICSYQPDLILVEKTVSRIARDMLLENGISLICNVKPVVIERISRFTGASIVSSLDAQIGVPQLGICQKFYLLSFNQKTFMYFDGCPQHLGCTVLLRGGTIEELKKIKSICSFMVFCDFNWQLERSFLMDEYCYPPHTIEDKENQTSNSQNSDSKDISPKVRSVLVDDNSDPLRSMASNSSPKEISSPINVSEVKDQKEDNFSELTPKLSHFLSKLQLNCSPFLSIPLPYLMTNSGNESKIRKYFKSNIIWSKRFETNTTKTDELLEVENNLRNREQSSPIDIPITRKHPLLIRNIKTPVFSHEIKSLVADFRANGPFSYCPSNDAKEVKPKLISANEVSDESHQKEKSANRMDVLNPIYHQKLSVLFSSFSYASNNAPNYCVKPWIIDMNFYGIQDIPLGGFLERYCFRPQYTCPSPSCSTPMIEHVRRFVHWNGCVLIVLRQLQQNVEAAQQSIITWSWCQKCKTGTPYSNLSQDSWLLSFGKYLELKFYGSNYKRRATSSSVACMQHSLHMDHFQFFAYKQVVASFKFMPIQIHDIRLPPTRIAIHCNTFIKTTFIEDLKQIAIKGFEIYSLILEKLCSIRDETNGTKYEIIVNEFKAIEAKERSIFRQKIEEIQLTLTSYSSEVIDDVVVYRLEDSMIQLKRLIAESVINWNLKINDFVVNKKKEEKLSTKTGSQTTASNIQTKTSPFSIIQNEEMNNSSVDNCSNIEELSNHSRTVSISSATSFLTNSTEVNKQENSPTEVLKACIQEQEKENEETLKALESIIEEPNDEKVKSDLTAVKSGATLSVSSYGYDVDIGINDCLENAVDFEADSDNYAVYNIHESKDDKQEDNQSLKSLTNVTNGSDKQSVNSSQTSAPKSDSTPFTVRNIFKELLSNANNLTINNPFPLSEHYALPTYKEDISFIVKDDDPGSIIAYALTSSEYERQINDILRQSSSPAVKRKLTVSTDLETTMESSTSKVSSNPISQHIDLQYNDSTTKFYCCVYFAQQFRKFRSNIFGSSDGEELYTRSLTTCIPWKARGGKSGSTFCKTLNDRFILKEMSKLELQSFLNIANYYFDYCTNAIEESRPSLLARIVGIYRTSYKNTATNNATKLYLLVMENLFYKSNISQKFDLKGSMRNRLVNTSSPNLKADQIVLLDENLMQMTCDCPLYVHSHSKAILRAAIDNDSLFLSSHSVMDYSLLVGIDDESKEFVVGIIDYIRPFTWDKKIESVVKSVGSQGKLPTIVQPDLYRVRFCDAMDQYFLCVPDKWHSIVKYD